MSILKLTPSCKDYLWGGSRLRTDFGVQSDLNPLAEAWVLSCHPDGPSYLPDGTMIVVENGKEVNCQSYYFTLDGLNYNARYVKVAFELTGTWAFADELEVR